MRLGVRKMGYLPDLAIATIENNRVKKGSYVLVMLDETSENT